MTQFNIRTLDLPSLHRSAIGFDRMFEELNRTFAASKTGNYPPHNIIQESETKFTIEVAVAGFAEDEIDVTLVDNILTVTGQKPRNEDEPSPHYLHHGISNRNFLRDFTLADNVQVRGALVQNGILAITLELEVPEEKKAKKIDITFAK
jgi:molecular chaperone IbpA